MTFLLLPALLFYAGSPKTMYHEDCDLFSSFFTNAGYYPQCTISEFNGLVNYTAEYADEYYNEHDDDDVNKLLVSIAAAGYVSGLTTWHSDYVLVYFENTVFSIPTSVARDVLSMYEDGYSYEELDQVVNANLEEHSDFDLSSLEALQVASSTSHTQSDLYSIMTRFPDITEFQFENAVDEYRGDRISGRGVVDDVGTVDLFDAVNAPDGYGYKVIVNLNGNSQLRAVIFLRTSTGLGSINIRDQYSFTGEIIEITDWGFWFTAYIKGD